MRRVTLIRKEFRAKACRICRILASRWFRKRTNRVFGTCWKRIIISALHQKLVNRASMWRALRPSGLCSRPFRRRRSSVGRVTSGSAGTGATNSVACRAFSTIHGFCCYALTPIWAHGCCRCWKYKSSTIGHHFTVLLEKGLAYVLEILPNGRLC